jgi:hypothetical protein
VSYLSFSARNTRVLLLFSMCTALLIFSGCTQNAVIRGLVFDVADEALPGVTVILEGQEQEQEDLSNATGRYSLRADRGSATLYFYKTGYTSARIEMDSLLFGVNEVPPVKLMPLPAEEGVFYQKEFRYQALEHPRINRYTTASGEPVFGTPVEPGLTLPRTDPEQNGESEALVFLAHKVQPYNAVLHRLRRIALKQGEAVKEKTDKTEAANQDSILVADQSVPLISRILDKDEGLLVELHPGENLEPGIYAFHWGALSGYDSLDPRAFLFAIAEDTPADEAGPGEGEGEAEIEGEEKG